MRQARSRSILVLGLAACVGLGPLAARAAQPAVPAKLAYQGVLLDVGATPRTGTVDLTLRVYDAAAGGALVYKQVFLGVALSSGVFTVSLGPNGAATDTPTNPLTTALANVFSSDVGAAGVDRFLEITVGSEGALARTQILTAPFALRAASADGVVAGGTLGGVSTNFVQQLFQYGDSDNAGVLNSDPREGFVDTDGDGKQNFVDPDNDGDGQLDGQEDAIGSNINLVTPTVTSTSPTSGFALGTTTVTVLGTNFQAGQTVQFGSQSPAPSALLPTSFQVVVGPQSVGAKNVRVTLPNGEQSPLPLSAIFQFTIGALAHAVNVNADTQLRLEARGLAQLAISGLGAYAVTPPSTDGAPSILQTFASEGGAEGQIAVGWTASGHLVGLRCRTTATDTCNVELSIDANDDRVFQPGEATVVETGLTGTGGSTPRLFSPDLALDGSGRLVLGYVKRRAGAPIYAPVVAHDLDGNGVIAPSERAEPGGFALMYPGAGQVAVDAAGRVAYAYSGLFLSTNAVVLSYDRNGDGDFLDANEVVTVASPSSLAGTPCVGLGFDPSGRVAVAYSGGFARVARDLNGDGDFLDPNEDQFVGGNSNTVCDVAGGGPLAVAYGVPGSNDLRLAVDRNDDGDFADANENASIGATLPGGARIAATRLGGGAVAVGWASSAGGQIVVDPNP